MSCFGAGVGEVSGRMCKLLKHCPGMCNRMWPGEGGHRAPQLPLQKLLGINFCCRKPGMNPQLGIPGRGHTWVLPQSWQQGFPLVWSQKGKGRSRWWALGYECGFKGRTAGKPIWSTPKMYKDHTSALMLAISQSNFLFLSNGDGKGEVPGQAGTGKGRQWKRGEIDFTPGSFSVLWAG